MSRRSALPGADELFRSTGRDVPAEPETAAQVASASTQGASASLRPSAAADLMRATGSEREPERFSERGSGSADQDRFAADDRVQERTPVARTVARIQPYDDVDRGDDRGLAPRTVGRRRAHAGDRRPTGRERHDEKITVYVSADELIDLEQARLVLRGEHGLAVDRGRIVREAVAVVLADLEAKGEQSILVRRLRGL